MKQTSAGEPHHPGEHKTGSRPTWQKQSIRLYEHWADDIIIWSVINIIISSSLWTCYDVHWVRDDGEIRCTNMISDQEASAGGFKHPGGHGWGWHWAPEICDRSFIIFLADRDMIAQWVLVGMKQRCCRGRRRRALEALLFCPNSVTMMNMSICHPLACIWGLK